MKEKTAVQVQERTPKKGFFKRLATACVALVAAIVPQAAFAAEGEGAASGGGDFTAVMGSMSTLSSLMTQVWNIMTSNPLLVLFLAVMLLGIGVSVFRMIKRAARR